MKCNFYKADEYYRNMDKDYYCFRASKTDTIPLCSEILEWCNNNIKNGFTTKGDRGKIIDGKSVQAPHTFVIFDKSEAMLFKLRWL